MNVDDSQSSEADEDDGGQLREAMVILAAANLEARGRIPDVGPAEQDREEREVGPANVGPLAVAREAVVDLENPGAWGAFTFSLKRDTRYGSYECHCPYHRKNKSTSCKKLFSLKGRDETSMKAALAAARWWASKALDYTLQQQHMFKVDFSSVPALEHLSEPAPALRVKPCAWHSEDR